MEHVFTTGHVEQKCKKCIEYINDCPFCRDLHEKCLQCFICNGPTTPCWMYCKMCCTIFNDNPNLLNTGEKLRDKCNSDNSDLNI